MGDRASGWWLWATNTGLCGGLRERYVPGVCAASSAPPAAPSASIPSHPRLKDGYEYGVGCGLGRTKRTEMRHRSEDQLITPKRLVPPAGREGACSQRAAAPPPPAPPHPRSTPPLPRCMRPRCMRPRCMRPRCMRPVKPPRQPPCCMRPAKLSFRSEHLTRPYKLPKPSARWDPSARPCRPTQPKPEAL